MQIRYTALPLAVLRSLTDLVAAGSRTPRGAQGGGGGGRGQGSWRTCPVGLPAGLENFFFSITSPSWSTRVARRVELARLPARGAANFFPVR